MKNILKKMALLAIPVVLWFVFFAAFEPNNYFGLKASASSSQPVARVRAYQQEPGTNLILGDSRLAHFDMQLVNSLTGQPWQNLAFGGASLKETLDLADYILNSGHEVDTLLAEVSFYTLNAGYNTDRFQALEETLNNPLAYCLNLEYNVNALTVAMDTLKGTPDTIESGDWTAADYLADDGTTLPLHRKLYDYPAIITPKCRSWTLNEAQLTRLAELAEELRSERIASVREVQERLTSILRGELREEQVVLEGCGEGMSEARVVERAPQLKDVTKAAELLAKMQGRFDNTATLNVVVPVFGGEDELSD